MSNKNFLLRFTQNVHKTLASALGPLLMIFKISSGLKSADSFSILRCTKNELTLKSLFISNPNLLYKAIQNSQ